MPAALKDRSIRQYKILRRLGEGGMGTVYLARVTKPRKGLRLGDEVALKILHPHLAANEDILRRFRREAGLGLTIRHPRVMATYDVGTEKVDGEPVHFIVMEVLPGRTLRQCLDADGAFDEERVVSIGRQVAEGLAEIHSRGIVHRDIKPSNVFVSDDGLARIADLGLSRLLEPDTEISLPGTFLGSVAYAAPEQMEGAAVGPEADLYALGVLLYELSAGKNPFAGGDLKATLHAHQHLTPRPLSEAAPGQVSHFLERLVQALLDKDPKRRLGPASRVAGILEQREQSEWWGQFVRGEGDVPLLTPARRQLKVRREARVHGRAAELDALRDALRTASVGRTGRVVLLCGEAGIGKSRLVDAALEHAEVERFGARAAVSRFLDLATPAPYYALNEALLMALDLKGRRDERHKPLAQALRDCLPERRAFAEAFAKLVDDPARAVLEHLPREAIPSLYAEAFRTLSVRAPLFVVIEELQWADRGSLRALDLLMRSIDAFPLALVLTARPEAFAADPEPTPSALFLRELASLPAATRIDLARLDRKAVREIVRDIGVPRSTEKVLAARLFRASEGNPAFLFELIDDLGRRGVLREPRHAQMKTLPIPSSIVDLFQRRLAELDPEARRFLDFASVFGPRFKLEPVIEGLGLDLVTAAQIVARLSDRHQLIRAFDRAYRFDHNLLRDRIYRELPADVRRKYHRAVARILARDVEDPLAPSRVAYEAAIHFSLADAHAEAATHLVGAVRYLVERNLFERAERLAASAVTHAELLAGRDKALPDRQSFAIYNVHAEISGHLGKRDAQARSLRLAASAAHRLADEALIAETELQLARFAGATARVFAALQHAEQARASAKRAQDPAREAASLRVKASVLRTLGQTDYEDLLRQAEEMARRAGDRQGLAFGQLLLGQLYLDTDRPMQALEQLKEAVRIFERLKDEGGRGRAFFQLARVYRQLGDLARAGRSADAAEKIASFRSDRVLLARCMYLNGDLAMRRRDYATAAKRLQQAAIDLEGDADRTYEAYAHVALALLFTAARYELRDPAKGVAHAARAVDLARQRRLLRPEAYAYQALAVAHLANGKPRFALAVSRKCLRFLDKPETGRRQKAEILFIHYRCLKALGQHGEARAHLLEARDLVIERAQEISETPYRRSFLQNDLFNAAVLRAAEQD